MPVHPPVALAATVAVTLLVYWPGLNGPLILDDVANLGVLRRLAAAGALSLANTLAETDALLAARPISFLSFVVNWRLTGDDVWALKLTNLALHVFNGALVYLVAEALMRAAGSLRPDSVRWFAVLAAALWMLTPVHVSTVLYVVQRMAELACAFTLLGVLAWCRGRDIQRRRPRVAIALMAVALLVCWPLATLSKQNGVLLLPLLLVIEWLVLARRPGASTGPVRVLVVITGLSLTLAAGRAWLDPGWILDGYEYRDFSLAERLMSQPRALLHQALNVLQLPGGTPLGLFHDDFAISRGWLDPRSTLPALLVCAALPLLAWRLRDTSAALPLLGIVFFLTASLLEAGPFALELYFEHRSYLPSVGLAVTVASLAAIATHRTRRPWLVASLAALVVAGHATLTATRVIDWTSWESIVETNARRHPASVRAQTGLAVLSFEDRRLDDGLIALSRARDAGGDRVRAGVALNTLTGYCLANTPPRRSALDVVGSLTDLDDAPYTVGALRWHREVLARQPCPGQERMRIASVLSRRVLSLRGRGRRGGNWILHDEMARLLAAAGEASIARVHLSRAIRLAPRSARGALMERRASLRGD